MSAVPDDRLIYEASQASTDAQLRLAELNLAAWTSGAVSQLEALAGAEVWARLAASSGRADAISVLADVFTARATFDGQRGLTGSAGWYEAEARRRRRVAGLIDHSSETPAVITIEPSPTPVHDAYLAAAAKGDAAALNSLLDDAVRLLRERACEPIEGLVTTEIYARIAAARGDPGSLPRLAGVLGARAAHEFSEGNQVAAAGAMAEGITLVSIVADAGDSSLRSMLESMVRDVTADGVVPAIVSRASILAHVPVQGSS